MKSTELMLGDWVYYTEFGDNRIAAIEGIEEHRVILSLKGLSYTPIDYVEPIPLTIEILEKNGFAIKKKFAQIGDLGNYPLILWHFEDNTIFHEFKHELKILQNDTRKVHIDIPCEYVHELQHALRLCGIDKEIKMEKEK